MLRQSVWRRQTDGRETTVPGGSWGRLAASAAGPMLALFASAMMMVPSDSDSSEGACEAPNTTTAAPSSDVSLHLPAAGVRPPAAPPPASSVGETPTTTLRTQAWRKGNVKAMWSVIEKGMFEDELGYLRVNSKGALEDLKPKARTQRLKLFLFTDL